MNFIDFHIKVSIYCDFDVEYYWMMLEIHPGMRIREFDKSIWELKFSKIFPWNS